MSAHNGRGRGRGGRKGGGRTRERREAGGTHTPHDSNQSGGRPFPQTEGAHLGLLPGNRYAPAVVCPKRRGSGAPNNQIPGPLNIFRDYPTDSWSRQCARASPDAVVECVPTLISACFLLKGKPRNGRCCRMVCPLRKFRSTDGSGKPSPVVECVPTRIGGPLLRHGYHVLMQLHNFPRFPPIFVYVRFLFSSIAFTPKSWSSSLYVHLDFRPSQFPCPWRPSSTQGHFPTTLDTNTQNKHRSPGYGGQP